MLDFKTHRPASWYLLLICAFSLALSLPGLWVPFFNIDELTNAIFAKLIVQGDVGLDFFLGNTYLLTHYLYAFTYWVFPVATLVPFHIVHALWKLTTILAMYWTGKQLNDRNTGLWAALFYAVFSTCFMSKDFHTPSAESLSIMPAVLCSGLVFCGFNRNQIRCFFLAGVFAAVATLFKAPMGVITIAMAAVILVNGEKIIARGASSFLGFVMILLLPCFFVEPFGMGFHYLAAKLSETNSLYIVTHSDVSFLYWFFKFIIRTSLVMVASFPMTLFAVYSIRMVFRFRNRQKDAWQKVFYLFVLTVLIWFAVAIGKRVFYHYYVFLFASLPMLAALGIQNFDRRLQGRNKIIKNQFSLKFIGVFRRGLLPLLILMPTVAFVDSAFNFSTQPENVHKAVEYIQQHTKRSDRIYVWGNVPQLYFFADRLPSTAYFWSDVLAGASPGTPAMEYIRATGHTLQLHELLTKDFEARAVEKIKNPATESLSEISMINETELFTVEELFDRIDHSYWRKVFRDFLKNPPELFIDSSPSNIRGFGFYPLYKYELLKRFVTDNYILEARVDGMDFYRLQK